jgi:hypothetical protein
VQDIAGGIIGGGGREKLEENGAAHLIAGQGSLLYGYYGERN